LNTQKILNLLFDVSKYLTLITIIQSNTDWGKGVGCRDWVNKWHTVRETVNAKPSYL